MERIKKIFVLVTMFLLSLGCFQMSTQAANSKVVLKLNTTKLALGKGENFQLKASVSGTKSKVKWSSSKSSVVSVSSSGKLKAKKAGTAVIKAKVGKTTAKCKVTVISLSAPTLSSWKKTHDSATCNCKIPHDGVEYTVTWKKVKGASGYQVYYYENEIGGGVYKNTVNTTKLKYSVGFSYGPQKLNAKVRAYKTVNGKKIFGPWSKVKSKTISYGNGSQTASTTVTFKKQRGKGYTYKNSKYSYGVGFGKTNGKVYIGVWNRAGTSASYEDFKFAVKDGQSRYTVKGLRSGYYYSITLTPGTNSVKVNMRCLQSSYTYFNINQTFVYTKNAYFLEYANG